VKNPRNPTVDETWIKYNPAHSAYEGQTLIHHHIDGGELVAAIPERLHYDEFSELHPYVNAGKSLQGGKISGMLGGTVNLLGGASMFSGLFSGDPGSWINAFGFGESRVGDIKKDWNANLYVQITYITEHYIPVFDASGQPVIDPQTRQTKYRLGSKTVSATIYSGYIWDEDKKSFEGVNKVGTKTEEWQYDDKGKMVKAVSSELKLPV
jgi:hypothetical protein